MSTSSAGCGTCGKTTFPHICYGGREVGPNISGNAVVGSQQHSPDDRRKRRYLICEDFVRPTGATHCLNCGEDWPTHRPLTSAAATGEAGKQS